MGGRGAAGGAVLLPEALLAELPYTVISFDDERGGAVYPFLEQTWRAWRILRWPIGAAESPHPAHTFGLDSPTLRWFNGTHVSDLYLDGHDTASFLAASGLQLELEKGGFVLSKRLSRLMRPHFISRFFAADEIAVSYLEQTEDETKVWDGAGLISRRLLDRMILSEDLPPSKRARLERELKGAQRVEFTLMTNKGQDKGHAIVAEDLRDADGRSVDFLLPQDTKGEIRLENGRTFVGLSIVHRHNHMRLDIQSLINLYPFFQEAQLLHWLEEEGELFVRSVETGKVAEVLGRIDPHTTPEELQAWPLREYLASGGHPMWFRSHVKSLLNQHLQRLNHTTLEKMRLPIPGGRHYVMPVSVGRRAGLHQLDVPPGHIEIDAARATAWVNDADWLALADSPTGAGIAEILGGADHDDALWLHPFTDVDGARKILAWRSPNQMGEYVILEPTANSHSLGWTATGEKGNVESRYFPVADSTRLPQRIDFTNPTYLGLVDLALEEGSATGEAYSIEAMTEAVSRSVRNQGALGMYCNALMLHKGLYGRLPDEPPAPLEAIIDGAVKTGADLSQVKAWTYAHTRAILESQHPIPPLLQRRLNIDHSDHDAPPPPPRSTRTSATGSTHWLDRLEGGIQAHIRHIETERERLVAKVRPPDIVLESASEEMMTLGAGLNKAFSAALRQGKGAYPSSFARARVTAEEYLSHFSPQQQRQILLGTLISIYTQAEHRSDAVVWLSAGKGDIGDLKVGIGQRTIQALRELGGLMA